MESQYSKKIVRLEREEPLLTIELTYYEAEEIYRQLKEVQFPSNTIAILYNVVTDFCSKNSDMWPMKVVG